MASTSTTTTSFPIDARAAERDEIVQAISRARSTTRAGRADGDHESLHRSGLQGRRLHRQRPAGAALRDPEDDARDGPRRRARRARSTSSGAGAKARRSTQPRRRSTRSSASARRSTSCASTRASRATSCGSRSKPSRTSRAATSTCATVGHYLAFIPTLDASGDGRRQPRGRARDDGRPELLPRRRAGARGRASCSTST